MLRRLWILLSLLNVVTGLGVIATLWTPTVPYVRFPRLTVQAVSSGALDVECPGSIELKLPNYDLPWLTAWHEDTKTICDRIATGRYYKDGPLALEPFHWSVSAPAVTVWREL